MLSAITAQSEILAEITALNVAETIDVQTIKVYAGEIDIVKLKVEAVNFPAVLLNFQGDTPGAEITPEPDSAIRFTLLICTASNAGLTEALTISEALKSNLLGVEFVDDDGQHLFHLVSGGEIRPVFNLKLNQVIAFPVLAQE